MHFDTKAPGNKSMRGRNPINLLNSPGLMVSASSISKTIFLSSGPNELCERLKLLLQEKHAGNNSNIINDEITAIIDKLLEYKCISKKQHKQILLKCNLLNKQTSISTHMIVHIVNYNYSNNCMYTFFV